MHNLEFEGRGETFRKVCLLNLVTVLLPKVLIERKIEYPDQGKKIQMSISPSSQSCVQIVSAVENNVEAMS